MNLAPHTHGSDAPIACASLLVPPRTLDAASRLRFDRDGFVCIESMTTGDEIDRIREIYDAMFAARRGWEKGDFFDTRATNDEAEALRLPQMFWLSRYEPSLRETLYHRNATAIARQILGPTAELVWEFAIMKPPHVGGETPWHQDDAFFTVGTDYDTAVSFWLPLQDVNLLSGCMQYVPGSHLGPLLEHDSIGGDPRTHGLEAKAPDISGAIACPLVAGSAVMHHSRTLHYAGPNLADIPRRAYILEFAVRSRARMMREDHPWNKAKNTARTARERRSMPLRRRLIAQVRRTLLTRFDL
jgi:ectoine hydroxylase-related dioxygenase (phytanoyl-CoA dioxygenase family)